MSPLNAPSTLAMDDTISLLDVHNNFGFSPCLVSQGGYCSKNATAVYVGEVETTPSQYPFELAQVGVDIPDFVSDQGTPNSTTPSLITPTQPLSIFIFPPVYEYQI